MLVGKPPTMYTTAKSARPEFVPDTLHAVTDPDRIPPELTAAISTALASVPEERFATAAQFRSSLLSMGNGDKKDTVRKDGGPIWRRKISLLVAALFLVIVTTITWAVVHSHNAVKYRIESIAVLPFRNLTNNANLDYFVDGMHETLISELANIDSLTIISRTSVMRFRGTNKSLGEIARELNVDAIVEGAVLGVLDSVRITTRLVRAKNAERLMTHTHEGTLADVLALQAEAAGHIVRDVRASRGKNTRGRRRL